MKRLKAVQVLLAGICLFFAVGIGVVSFPWYTQELPLGVQYTSYTPGQETNIIIKRDAKINLIARAVVELVRFKEGREEEVFNFTKDFEMDRGKKTVVVAYKIPELKSCPRLKENGSEYMWRGGFSFTPVPGFPEIQKHFTTEKFHIKVDRPDAQRVLLRF